MLTEEKKKLRDIILVQVKRLKEMFGEFYPIGAIINTNGEITPFGAFGEEEYPQVQEVIEHIQNAFSEGVLLNKYIAAALAVDVRFLTPDTEIMADAIEIRFDSKKEGSINIYITYKFEDNEIVFYKMYEGTGTLRVFSG